MPLVQRQINVVMTLLQLSRSWLPGVGQLFANFSPSGLVHGVEAGDEEGREVESEQLKELQGGGGRRTKLDVQCGSAHAVLEVEACLAP